MDRNPNSPDSPSVGSTSSTFSALPQTLDPNVDGPSSPPPTAAGSKQDLLDPNSPDFRPDQVTRQEGEEEKEEKEEEAECAFCLFMKGGGCKDQFIAWENCVEEAEKNKEDMVEKCFEVTSLLKKCMEANADYYEPILRAEEAMSDSVAEDAMSESVAEEARKESVEVDETIIEAVSEEVAEARDSKVGD